MSKKLFVLDHPVLKHKLGYLRDKETDSIHFRLLMNEISYALAYEATKDLETIKRDVETPLSKANIERVVESPVIVSIMRAGNGMLEGIQRVLPFAPAGHIGIYRDKFINNTVEYYFKIPEKSAGKTVLLLDPLCATGDTVVACIDRLKQFNVGKIKFLTVCVGPSGLEKLHHFHPDVDVYTLSKEEGLNENGYLLPGIGDAGDRIYKMR